MSKVACAILKYIYLFICVGGGMGFILTIEAIFTKCFYIPIFCCIACVLGFFAAIPYFSDKDIEMLRSDDNDFYDEEVDANGYV